MTDHSGRPVEHGTPYECIVQLKMQIQKIEELDVMAPTIKREFTREIARFYVEGNPTAKQSFRVSIVRDENGKVKRSGFQPARVTGFSQAVGYKVKEVIKNPIPGPIGVEMYFFMQNARVVDLDNLSKNVLDGMKNIAFGDDCRVVELFLRKMINRKNPGLWVILKGKPL
jgi:Holliday junction resolvase RusA-like endonuclease